MPSAGRRRRPGGAGEPPARRCPATHPWSLRRPATGRNQGQGRRPASRDLRAPKGTESQPGRRPQGSSPAATCATPSRRLRRAGLAKPRAKRKQAQEVDPVRAIARATSAPVPERKSGDCAARIPRTSNPYRWRWSAWVSGFPSPPVLRPELMSTRPGCGAGGARRCGAVSLLPMNVPRPRPREREAGALWKERSGNLCSQCGVSLRVRVESLTARCSASAVPK